MTNDIYIHVITARFIYTFSLVLTYSGI